MVSGGVVVVSIASARLSWWGGGVLFRGRNSARGYILVAFRTDAVRRLVWKAWFLIPGSRTRCECRVAAYECIYLEMARYERHPNEPALFPPSSGRLLGRIVQQFFKVFTTFLPPDGLKKKIDIYYYFQTQSPYLLICIVHKFRCKLTWGVLIIL